MQPINSRQVSAQYQLGGVVSDDSPSSEEMDSSLNKLLWSAVLISYMVLMFMGFHLQPEQPAT